MSKIIQSKSHRIVDINGRPITSKPVYDSIQSTQQAINMAIGEQRVVRFKTTKTNAQIKAEITDLKGCAMRKPSKESDEVAIIPPWINDFCFEEAVDTTVVVRRDILK